VRRSKPTPDVKVDRSRIPEPLRAQGGDDLVPDSRRSLLADVTSLEPAGVGVLFYLDAFVRTRRGRLVLFRPGGGAVGTITGVALERHFSVVDEPGGPRGPRPTVPVCTEPRIHP
jgi:hypothetical protein